MKNNESTKILNLILGTIFTTNVIYAREVQLSGRIVFNDDSTAIASIELFDKQAKLKSTTLSNPESGHFVFESVKPGATYLLICSSMGYLTDTLRIEAVSEDMHMGEITMKPDIKSIREVTITANMVESFASKDQIYIPSQIKNYATSGYDAIRQLPQLAENIVLEKLITPDRKSIKILINGIESTEKDLKVIPAKEILRVEYFSNPPVRYANLGIGAVINVITSSSHISGADILISTKNAVTTASGTNTFDTRFYNNNNQFNIGYSIDYRSLNDNLINQDYDYRIDDKQYKNIYDGVAGLYKGEMHVTELGYLHHEEDNFTFSAKAKARFNPGNENYSQRTIVVVDNQPPVEGMLYKKLKSNYRSGSGDLYFTKQLKNNQEIVANLVGTYFSSYSKNDLQRRMNDMADDFDYRNTTENKSWSAIGELLYNKKMGAHELTAGFRFHSKELRQTYNETLNSDISQQVYYLYAGLNGSFAKLKYSLEMGAEKSRNKLTGDERVKTDFTSFNPSLSLLYPLSKVSVLKFTTRAYGSVPEVSMLTLSPVYLNYNYLSVGNPNLKPYYILQSELKYQLSGSHVFMNTGFNYNHSFNPFVASFVKENDQILKTWAYKDYRSFIGYTMSMRWTPCKWMALQTFFALGYTEIGNKDGSHFTDFTKLASFSLTLMYKKFRLLTQMQTVFSNLFGDYLEKTGAALISELSYTNKSLTLGIQYIKNPNPKELISKNPVMHLNEETIWEDYRNLVMIKASYRFYVGKKNTIRANQRITNSDDDSGLREDAKAK